MNTLATQMRTYKISTNMEYDKIVAASADEAARSFATRHYIDEIESAEGLRAWVESSGGHGVMEECETDRLIWMVHA